MTPHVEGPVRQQTLQLEKVAASSQGVHLTSSSLIARNATLNLLSEGWIFLVLLVAMPRLVRSLGEASFGLFSLAWVIIGYLTVLDIGVSRAATKFVSEHLAERDLESTRRVVRTAIIANLGLGFVGGAVVATLSPFLVHSVFQVAAGLEGEASLAFYSAAFAVPVLLLNGILRGVLTSFQRFGWITGINTLATTVQWWLGCYLASRGHGVALVVLSTVIVRMLATAGYGAVVSSILPRLTVFRMPDFGGLLNLLRFGTWVTVSQLVSPLLVYLDRILIGTFVSLGAVALYTVPYEVMTRLRVVPSSLVASLFPAFSERGSRGKEAQLQRLYDGSVRYLLLLLVPITLFLAVLGPDLLAIWMGATFAQKTGRVLQILALGALANGIAYVPYNMLQAIGRPDITGKFHLLELPFYVILCIALVPRWGIEGAALASTARFGVDAMLLLGAVRRYCSFSQRNLWKQHLPTLTSGIALGLLLLAAHRFTATTWGLLSCGVSAVAAYFLANWWFALKRDERLVLRSLFASLRVDEVA